MNRRAGQRSQPVVDHWSLNHDDRFLAELACKAAQIEAEFLDVPLDSVVLTLIRRTSEKICFTGALFCQTSR
ncbi:hypothetical protein MFUM_480023 [Methylacidiphilum fumariolicum SolV]|uniref:Uncharacterized protein n=2 Tax=Candidatus Methylacidiphilum fumarolicum TaxID=591154 RepID=I0JY87_METFB|nr:conserved protein of unknown function [Candidatus Methylacidiphilum fumarolicum]CCG92206.1 hypothetical protein MFUM_480023 [Methylacidiphilum fumariolicum SolV]